MANRKHGLAMQKNLSYEIQNLEIHNLGNWMRAFKKDTWRMFTLAKNL